MRAVKSARRRRAALLRELLAESEIRESHRYGDPRVQDAYALRCMPQVHGPVLDAIEFAAGVVGRELNAATDNPLVFETRRSAERRELSRPVGGDGARLARHRADESRDDRRAAHRPARESRT